MRGINQTITTEKTTAIDKYTEVQIEENQIVAFNKADTERTSFKVHKGNIVGVYYKVGKISDKEGFEKAEKNLESKRLYPFALESGERSLDKTETILSDTELMDTAKKVLKYLTKEYPDYTFNGSLSTVDWESAKTNSCGMDYRMRDGNNTVGLSFKHKDSKDISDGYISYSVRTFKMRKFCHHADFFLKNFTKTVEMPKECIILDRYYGYMGKLRECLNIETLKEGTSLLSGKIGQKVFADDFTLMHDLTEKNIWMDTFWDGDGVTLKNDRATFIRDGKVLRGYADKRFGKRYKVQSTGGAIDDYRDIPWNGKNTMTIKVGKKTVKEILDGRYAIIPIQSSGGGFKEKGEYTMPVQIGLLTDGEKVLGRVPPFTISTNMFDMFGKDFLGVAKFDEVLNDKCILMRVTAGKL